LSVFTVDDELAVVIVDANVAPLLRKYVYHRDPRTPIVRAAHGDASGVRGAAMLWPV